MRMSISGSIRSKVAGRAPVLLAAGVAALAIAGCGSSSSGGKSAAQATSGSSGKAASSGSAEGSGKGAESVSGKSVFVVTCAPVEPYCAAWNKDLQQGLEAKGVQVKIATNPKNSAQEEHELDEAISQKPNLIINLPTDSYAVRQGYTRAKEAGIPVLSTVNPVSPEAAKVVTAQVFDNNHDMGKVAAENIQAGLKQLGMSKANVIAITGNTESLTTTERLNAFKAQLATTPQYALVASQPGNWEPILTQEIASKLFAAHAQSGGIQAAYGMSGEQAAAIVRAAKQAGLPVGIGAKGLIVSGSNCGPNSVKSIAAGEMFGDATETPSGDVKAVLPVALKLLAGESVPKITEVPETAITKANVAKYREECTF